MTFYLFLTTSLAFPFKIELYRFNLMAVDASNIWDKRRVIIYIVNFTAGLAVKVVMERSTGIEPSFFRIDIQFLNFSSFDEFGEGIVDRSN